MSMTAARSVTSAASASSQSGANLSASGRQAWSLLWAASRRLSFGVIACSVANALAPPLVVGALGAVVGQIPGAIKHGMSSAAGHRLIAALVIAALIYAVSLLLDPISGALGTAARSQLTGRLQQRLLAAVSGPTGINHLEDPDVLDRLARAEGSLTGFFPGDAPVTWAGIIAARASGVIGCIVVAIFSWWLGLGLLVMWFVVRR